MCAWRPGLFSRRTLHRLKVEGEEVDGPLVAVAHPRVEQAAIVPIRSVVAHPLMIVCGPHLLAPRDLRVCSEVLVHEEAAQHRGESENDKDRHHGVVVPDLPAHRRPFGRCWASSSSRHPAEVVAILCIEAVIQVGGKTDAHQMISFEERPA